MWEALQHTGWVTTLATSRWLYGLVSVVHYSAVFFVRRNDRPAGPAYSRCRRSESGPALCLPDNFGPGRGLGLGAVAVSGFLLFAVEAGDFAAVTPFRLKMLIVVLAVISALAIEWSVPKWDRAPVMPVTARLLALISIVLWLGAILVSVEIPALTGLG